MEGFSADFELYKHFYYAAECGNLTLAAQRLFLTQPSLSKSIQKLEETLGCTLFVRSKRGVKLTPEGQVLMNRVEPACRLLYAAEQELESMRTLETGTVSIVSTEMSFSVYVLPAMERFVEKHPGIKIKFSNALNRGIMEMLRSGQVDIAIMHEPFEQGASLELHQLDCMEDYFVAGNRYSYLKQRKSSVEDLAQLPFISMPEGSSSKKLMHDYFQRHGLEFEPDIELTTVELMAQAIENNFGLGTLPEHIAQVKIREGRMFRIPVSSPLPMRKAFAITNRDRTPSMAAQAFLSELMQFKPRSEERNK